MADPTWSGSGIGRMFSIEARMLRAMAGDRAEFDEHAIEDVQWLLTRANQMWSLLPSNVQAEFRDGPEDLLPGAVNPPPWIARERVITTAMLEEWASEAEVGRDVPGWMRDALAQPQHDYDENGQAVAWDDDSSSPIDRIKALRNQGYSLTEAKRVVHASLSDEERANVERLWEEMEGGAT